MEIAVIMSMSLPLFFRWKLHEVSAVIGTEYLFSIARTKELLAFKLKKLRFSQHILVVGAGSGVVSHHVIAIGSAPIFRYYTLCQSVKLMS